jgi:hypothetical protein
MEKAKLFSIRTRDLIKGLIVAIITAVLTFIINELQAGTVLDAALYKRMGITAAIAFLSYILKNFLTNSKDEFATPEPKPPVT